VPRLVRHQLIIFENFEKYLLAMPKNLKETLSTLASLICIVPNCKILLFLLLKVSHKKLIIIRHKPA
jgi:hypothetical protein